MARKGPEQSTVFLINVGVTEQGAQPNLLLLERMKDVAKRLIEKQIFKNPKDEIAILIMSRADVPRNPDKLYITLSAPMGTPTFEMVNKISNLKGTNNVCNWLYSLYDAIKYLLNNGYVPPIKSKYKPLKKIIVISHFKEDAKSVTVSVQEELIKSLQENKIHLFAVGEENLHNKAEDSFTHSEKILDMVLRNVSGQFLTLNNVMKQLLYYKCPQKKQNRWTADLELGILNIPIVAYIKVKPFDKLPHWQRYAGNQKVTTCMHYLDRHHNAYTQEERIKGYKWAGVFQAITDEYVKRFQYLSGPKSYQIYGFTKRSNVSLDLWCDGSTRIILPASANVAKQFYCLVQAMYRNDSIAIVRRIYCKNRTPTMMALYPCINVPDEPWCLVEMALPYAETRRMLVKKSIKSIVKSATNEQRKLVEQLVSKLTLNASESESETEPFAFPGTIPNPTVQHGYHMLSHRALNPDKPLPQMEDYLKTVLDSPIGKETTKTILEDVKTAFQLKQTMPKRKRKPEELSQVSTEKIENVIEQAKEKIKCEKVTEFTPDDIELDDLLSDLKDADMDDWGSIVE